MKYIKRHLSNIQGHHLYDKAIYWTKNISITSIAQIAVQGLGFISGILIIRLLPVEEYALYTLANTMLGTISVLGDGGISTGVMSQGGKVWQDPKKLGSVLITGLYLRRKFAIVSLAVSLPILIYLLLHNGASWLATILIVLSIIPAFYAALSDSLLEIIPKLHQSILPLQKNQVGVATGRLILTSLTIFIFPWTFVAILASGIPRLYGNIKLRKISDGFVDTDQMPDLHVRNEILKLVKQNMPGLIYYCISGQITIWILSLFGNTTSIAQIGALGRITILLGIITPIFSMILIPRFARLENQDGLIYKKYLQLILIFGFTCFVFLFFSYLFSYEILWILGAEYRDLKYELILSLFGGCIFSFAGFVYSLTSNRGFVLNPVIYISLSIISIIIGVIIFDVTTLKGVLHLNILVSTIQLLMYIIYANIIFLKTN